MRCWMLKSLLVELGPLAIALTVFGARSPAAVQTYAAGADMVANEVPNGHQSNPNGPWSYGSSVTLGGPFSSFTIHTDDWVGGGGQLQGYGAGFPSLPLLVANVTGSAFSPCCGFSVDPSTIFLHPGNIGSSDFDIVRWTAPAAGAVRFDYVNFVQKGGKSAPEYVLLNGTILASGSSTFSPAIASRNVVAGDTIDFVVGPDYNDVGDPNGSRSTQFDAQIVFTPPSILPPLTNRALWLSADQGVRGTSRVTGWKDAGDGRQWVASVLGNPTASTALFPDGAMHKTIAFDGASGLNLAGLDLPSPTVYLVGRLNGTQQSRIFISDYHDVSGWGLGISDGTANRVKWFTAPPNDELDSGWGDLVPGRFYQLTASIAGNGAKTLRLSNDGATFASVAVSNGVSMTHDGSEQLSIGYLAPNNVQHLIGEIAEVLVYSSAPSPAQQKAVEGYLDSKYFGVYNASAALMAGELGPGPYANGDGIWTYGYRTVAEGHASAAFHPLAAHGLHGAGMSGWKTSDNDWECPLALVNVTDGPTDPGYLSGNTVPFGEMLLHPAPTNADPELAGRMPVVRWTAPSDGLVNIAAVFGQLNAATTDLHVVRNGASLFDGEMTAADPFGTQKPADLRGMQVRAGDVIDAVVGWGNGNPDSDSTGLNFTISYRKSIWTPTGGGSWSSPENWNAYIPQMKGDDATFASSIGSASVEVALDGPGITVSSLVFSNASGGSYTVSPGAGAYALTLSSDDTSLPVSVSAGSHAITAELVLANHARMATAAGAALTISGPISESGGPWSLTKSGAGMLALSGTNTYSGATTVTSGLLRLDSAAALPGGVGVSGGTSALKISGGVVGLGSADFLRNLGADSSTLQFTDSGGFAACGADRVVNFNNDAHEVTWADGLFVPNNLVLGAADATHTVDLRNAIHLNGASRTVQVDNGAAAIDAKLSGSVRGSGAEGIVKTGEGTLELAAANAYSSGTTINAGTLVARVAGSLGDNVIGNDVAVAAGTNLVLGVADSAGPNQKISVTSTAAALGGIGLAYDGTPPAITDNTGGFGGVFGINTGTFAAISNLSAVYDGNWFLGSQLGGTFTGTALAPGNGSTYRLGGGGGTLTIANSNVLTGDAGVIVGSTSANGSGTIVLAAPQDYTGPTTIDAGALKLTSPGAIPSGPGNGDVTVNSVLDLHAAITINGLAGTGTVTTSATDAKELTIGANDASSTFSGVIQDGSGAIALVKTGSGVQVLTGNSTYTGGATVSGGTLQIGDGGSTGRIEGHVLLRDGANLTFSRNDRPYTFSQPYDPVTNPGYNQTITGIGSVTFRGGGIPMAFDLTTAKSYQGDTYFEGSGWLVNWLADALPTTTVLRFQAVTAPLIYDFAAQSVNPVQTLGGLVSDISPSVGVYSDTGGTLTLNVVQGDAHSFGGVLGMWFGGRFHALFSVVKSGPGSQVLNGPNVYEGSTTISGGSLVVTLLTDGGVTDPNNPSSNPSSIGSSPADAANLVLDGGTLRYMGGGNTSNRLFTLTANGGVIDASGGGPISFTSNGLVAFSGSGPRTLTLTGDSWAANTLSPAIGDGDGGATSLLKTGSGTWVVSGSNFYSGPTIVAEGLLQLGADGAVPAGARMTLGNGTDTTGKIELDGHGLSLSTLESAAEPENRVLNNSLTPATLTIDDNNSEPTTFGGSLGGELDGANFSLVKRGSGRLVLSGVSTYTGGTQVESGMLTIANPAGLPVGGSLTVEAGGTVMLASGLSVASGARVEQRPAAPIPEPCTLVLLAVATLAALGLGLRGRM